jgi:hypothetical protein
LPQRFRFVLLDARIHDDRDVKWVMDGLKKM